MKKTDIIELTDTELKSRIDEERIAYARLKFNHAVSGIENPLKIRTLRKTIAQLKTELHKRVLKTQNKKS